MWIKFQSWTRKYVFLTLILSLASISLGQTFEVTLDTGETISHLKYVSMGDSIITFQGFDEQVVGIVETVSHVIPINTILEIQKMHTRSILELRFQPAEHSFLRGMGLGIPIGYVSAIPGLALGALVVYGTESIFGAADGAWGAQITIIMWSGGIIGLYGLYKGYKYFSVHNLSYPKEGPAFITYDYAKKVETLKLLVASD